jgi:tetratricopeptide (TPR) repeat protein
MHLGKYDNAIHDFRWTLLFSPYDESVYVGLGQCYVSKKMNDSAKRNFNRALLLDANNWRANFALAGIYFNEEKIVDATRYYSIAIAIKPTEEAYKNRSICYFKRDMYDSAAADYETIISINSTDADIYFRLGACYVEMGSYRSAVEAFSFSIKLDPNNANTFCNRGACYAELKKYELAIRDFSRALEINPNLTIAKENKEQCKKDILKKTE